MSYEVPLLPLTFELESKPVLKKLARAHQALAELKGVAGIIPNQVFLQAHFLYRKPKIVQRLRTSLQHTMNYIKAMLLINSLLVQQQKKCTTIEQHLIMVTIE